MADMPIDSRCPISGIAGVSFIPHPEINSNEVDSPRLLGRTTFTDSLFRMLMARTDPAEKRAFGRWIVDRKLTGTLPESISSHDWNAHQYYRKWSLTEKADRLFRWLIDRNKATPLTTVRVDRDDARYQEACAVSDSASSDELQLVAMILAERGHIEFFRSGEQPSRTHYSGRFRLTPAGWVASEKRPDSRGSDTAFVAMWFSEPMEPAKRSILEAIEAAGYRPIIVSDEIYTGPIMDKVLGEIRSARFVVADYTCGSIDDSEGTYHYQVRGGVYFEAGFALGQGLEVISTVRSDLFDPAQRAIHFDLQQYNHIGWNDPAELRAALEHRIGAIIGWGPLRSPRL